MIQNWEPSLEFVWQFDGLRHDAAPGEDFVTSYGVTAYTWAVAQSRGIITKPIEAATRDDCAAVLRALVWNGMHCDDLEAGCDLVLFNAGMLAGAPTAVRLAQRVVGEIVDGILGPLTELAIRGFGQTEFIHAITLADENYLYGLRNAPLFIKGWTRREDEAMAAALKLANLDG